MVKALQRTPLPKQDTREQTQLSDALESLRRRDKVRPVPLRVQYEKPTDAGTGTTVSQAIYPGATRKIRVSRVALVCDTTEVADGSHYATWRVEAVDPDGNLPAIIITRDDTADLGLTANVARTLTIEAPEVPADWALRFVQAKTGSGVLVGRCVVVVEGEELR